MIDYEDTSFGFNRRRDFVKALNAAKMQVVQRQANPGHESVERLARLQAALDDVLNDEVFEPHARQLAEREQSLTAKT